MHYQHELHLSVPTKGCFLVQEHDFLCNKDSQTKAHRQTVWEQHGEKRCHISPRDPLRTRTHHYKLHLGLRPALHHHRQRTAAAGWDSKSGWLWDCWCLNVTPGRDGTIVFTLRERTIVSVKTGADLISLSTVSIRQLMEGYMSRCAACVSLPYRLGVLKDFQEVNQKHQTNSILFLAVVYCFFSFRIGISVNTATQAADRKGLLARNL